MRCSKPLGLSVMLVTLATSSALADPRSFNVSLGFAFEGLQREMNFVKEKTSIKLTCDIIAPQDVGEFKISWMRDSRLFKLPDQTSIIKSEPRRKEVIFLADPAVSGVFHCEIKHPFGRVPVRSAAIRLQAVPAGQLISMGQLRPFDNSPNALLIEQPMEAFIERGESEFSIECKVQSRSAYHLHWFRIDDSRMTEVRVGSSKITEFMPRKQKSLFYICAALQRFQVAVAVFKVISESHLDDFSFIEIHRSAYVLPPIRVEIGRNQTLRLRCNLSANSSQITVWTHTFTQPVVIRTSYEKSELVTAPEGAANATCIMHSWKIRIAQPFEIVITEDASQGEPIELTSRGDSPVSGVFDVIAMVMLVLLLIAVHKMPCSPSR